MALVDDVEEHVGGVRAVGEIADFVDDQHIGMRVRGERLGEPAGAEAVGQIIDQFRGGDEAGIEAVLDRPIGRRDGEMRFAAPGFSEKDQGAPLGDEIRRQRGAQEREPHGGLVGEIEIVDRLEEGKRGAAHEPGETRLLALGDFLGDEHREELRIGPLLLLRTHEDVPPHATGIGEVQALEQRIQIDVGHRRGLRASTRRGGHPNISSVRVGSGREAGAGGAR